MDVSWFILMVLAAIFVSTILLAVVCLDCRNKSVLVYVSQTHASEEYIPSSEFSVIRPSQTATDQNSFTASSNNLSHLSPLAVPGTQRRPRSVTPIETGSIPSYENQAGPQPADSDAEDAGYILVLPDDEAPPTTNQSRASTPSSDRNDYVNLEHNGDYLNVYPGQIASEFVSAVHQQQFLDFQFFLSDVSHRKPYCLHQRSPVPQTVHNPNQKWRLKATPMMTTTTTTPMMMTKKLTMSTSNPCFISNLSA
uniref:linker for activation of T-cells family member 1 isoform X2 n=1 Tax=Monopterus albus TaxID=43700 RepID=UPI0009B4A936|nr:uncharacterized protein LOC109967555 isoform X2 [Monopterus albus]